MSSIDISYEKLDDNRLFADLKCSGEFEYSIPNALRRCLLSDVSSLYPQINGEITNNKCTTTQSVCTCGMPLDFKKNMKGDKYIVKQYLELCKNQEVDKTPRDEQIKQNLKFFDDYNIKLCCRTFLQSKISLYDTDNCLKNNLLKLYLEHLPIPYDDQYRNAIIGMDVTNDTKKVIYIPYSKFTWDLNLFSDKFKSISSPWKDNPNIFAKLQPGGELKFSCNIIEGVPVVNNIESIAHSYYIEKSSDNKNQKRFEFIIEGREREDSYKTLERTFKCLSAKIENIKDEVNKLYKEDKDTFEQNSTNNVFTNILEGESYTTGELLKYALNTIKEVEHSSGGVGHPHDDSYTLNWVLEKNKKLETNKAIVKACDKIIDIIKNKKVKKLKS
tara:strand:- start:3299 stop:4459 length:1161 start_codon:yes stop_codon:yes gene_type:complete